MKTYSFEKLETWQMARSLAVKIYKVTRDFPEDEKFGIISQMRRAGISISSNIAEGSARFSSIDQARFYEIAYGSQMELLNQLIISVDLEYLPAASLLEFRAAIDDLAFKISTLRKEALKAKN